MVALALAMALLGFSFFEPDFVSIASTLDVGHGPFRLLFLGLILCLVPMTPCETMLYWPHTSALVAYNGGTSLGHGPVRTLFLEHFVSSAGTLDVGHGPVTTLFLGLVLCLVPKLCYIGPIPVPWWPVMVALALAMALSGLFFLSLILLPVLAHWIFAMALPRLFSWA